MRRAAVLALVLFARAAYAEGEATSAQTLFEEGRRLMQAGDYAAACPKLAESQRLDPGAGTLLNLAACYEKQDKLASAWVTYTEAASDADRSNRPEWAKKGKDKASALQPILTTLAITVAPAANVEGLEVLRDGHPLATAERGVKVPVDGGDHLIEARAPGYEPWRKHVSAPAKRGALAVTVPPLLEVRVAAAASLHAGASAPAATRPGTQRTIGVVLAAAGIVGLGAGGVFTGIAVSRHNEAKGNCTSDETLCNATGLERYDAAGDAANIATAAFITGGVLLAGGVILYLLAPKSSVTAFRRGAWTF